MQTMIQPQRHVIIICGMTGSGKSTLARSVIAKSSRTIIVDPNSEYHDALVVESVDDFLDYFIEEKPETFRVAIRIHNRFSVPESDMDAVFQSVWEIGNVLFVVEEVDAYIPPLERQNAFMPLISEAGIGRFIYSGLPPGSLSFREHSGHSKQALCHLQCPTRTTGRT